MALVQALVIAAALAAVAGALILRAERARERLEWRGGADQATLAIAGAMDLLRRTLPRGVVDDGQDWARPASGIVLDAALLDWQVSDLQGRFNLNLLPGDPQGAMRAAFLRLAAGHGLSEAAQAQVLALIDAAGDGVMPVSQPLYLRGALAPADRAAWDALAPDIASWPPALPMNLNTLRPAVLAALLPGLGSAPRDALLRRLATTRFDTVEAFLAQVLGSQGAEVAAALAAVPLGTGSRLFSARIEARLDSLVLRRSGVIDTGGPEGRDAVLMSLPWFE